MCVSEDLLSWRVRRKQIRSLAHFDRRRFFERIPYLPSKFTLLPYLPLRKFSFPICHWAKLHFPSCHFRPSVRMTVLESRWKDYFTLGTNSIVKFGVSFLAIRIWLSFPFLPSACVSLLDVIKSGHGAVKICTIIFFHTWIITNNSSITHQIQDTSITQVQETWPRPWHYLMAIKQCTDHIISCVHCGQAKGLYY